MTSAISHRGSDGIHHMNDGPIAIGHCMLCTTPEWLRESQPPSLHRLIHCTYTAPSAKFARSIQRFPSVFCTNAARSARNTRLP
jgi:hypothetical protein